jgi:hypothetical protein
VINTRGQFSYLTDSQVQFTIVFWWMVYQYSWNMYLFLNDNTVVHAWWGQQLIFSALSDSTWTRLSVSSR